MSDPAPAAPRSGEPTQTHKDLFRNGFHAKVYGFLRGDFEADSRRMNIDSQLPFFVLSPSTTNGPQGDATFHTRLTRVGLDVAGPNTSLFGGWKPSAKLETDFYNAFVTGGRDLVSNSRSALRIRLAYLRLQKGDWFVLGGQNWDVISPLFPSLNADTVMWNAGNPADRRAQLRVGYEPKMGPGRLSLVGMVGSTGAVDGADLNGDGFRDGEQAIVPTVQARVGYSVPSWVKGQDFVFGLYGHKAKLRTGPFVGKNDYSSHMVGIDYSVPIHTRIKLLGEWWNGQALGDVRAGIGQSLNAATGREISASGGWNELSYKAAKFYTVNFGQTLDAPRPGHIPVAGRTRNRVFYITNRFDLGNGVNLGLDFANWKTNFQGQSAGQNNRYTVYMQYNF